MSLDGKSGRILYVCGGRGFFSHNLNRKLMAVAECWRQAGHDVKQICGGDIYGERASHKGEYGAQATHSRWYRNRPGIEPLVTSMSEWRDIRHDRLMLRHMRAVCKDWRPNLIWERSCRLHVAGLNLAREIGVPYVLEWKDHLVDYRFSVFRGKALRTEARKDREADRIVVESEVLRDEMMRLGTDSQRLIVAHNAVKAEQFSQDELKRARFRQELGIDADVVLVGYLGSYAFYHDTERLVRAARIIRENGAAAKTKILMVGAGKEYASSKKLAMDLGLTGDILIMKPGVPQDEVPAALAALDIAVLPGSTDIICPIKVQEYMACGLAVVVPDYLCNREVINDGETGVVFEPKDAGSLAQKIQALANDRNLRERLGANARNSVRKRFSWSATWGRALSEVLTQ